MKKTIILTLSLFAFCSAMSQSADFPLYFSNLGLNGTANYISRAGALGAVGGDIMSSNYNPAGLGIYKGNEVTFSSGINFNFMDANSDGLKSDDNRTSYNFGNFGMVGTFRTGSKGLKYIQLAFGLNRLKNFSGRTKIMRNGVTTSYIDHTVMDAIVAANDAENDFIQAGVINVADDGTISSVYESGTFNQIKQITQTGYVNEVSFSFSGNVDDMLYFGATVGIPYAEYKSVSTFSEERINDNGESNGHYNYNEVQELSASGVNFKLGAIVKPINFLRIGAAIHTPTYYYVEDDYYSKVVYNSASGSVGPTFVYDIQTPFRFLGSLALVFGDNKSKVAGTISADYEYADYKAMKFRMEDDVMFETDLNNIIDNIFRPANTFRFGGELKLGVLSLRAGYAMMGNPYIEEQNDASFNCITAGIGYKTASYSFDLAYANVSGNSRYYFYDDFATALSNVNHLVQATFAIRF